ncbi:MAG: hypothetical protein WB988_03670, partial [Candidatus Nitrosopolaris sp.]
MYNEPIPFFVPAGPLQFSLGTGFSALFGVVAGVRVPLVRQSDSPLFVSVLRQFSDTGFEDVARFLISSFSPVSMPVLGFSAGGGILMASILGGEVLGFSAAAALPGAQVGHTNIYLTACGPYISRKGGECHHTTVEYGPCMSDKDFGCKYKTRSKDYIVSNKGTKQEQVFINRYS